MSTNNDRRPSQLLWARPAPGSARPRFTRERIAEVAMAVAEKEGIEALSMRRLAEELGAGTMTLYHYLPSKRDLFAFIEDRIMAELVIPDAELASNWRDAVTQLARNARAVWKRRSWAIMSVQTTHIGPNGMRVLEQSLAVLADTPLDAAQKLEVISLIDSYVLSFVVRENASESSGGAWINDVAAFMSSQLQTGDFPHIRQLIGAGDTASFVRRLAETSADEHFERGLNLILDGVARLRGTQRKPDKRPTRARQKKKRTG